MSIVQQAGEFVQRQVGLLRRTSQAWRRCPYCGNTATQGYGSYVRHPYTLEGREARRVRRHYCPVCRKTYSEELADLAPRARYAREVQRCAVDLWVHGRMSLRRVAEVVQACVGHQGRWLYWCWLRLGQEKRALCPLSASTVHRWVAARVDGQWEGVASTGQMGVDGLWARLRGGAQRVVLLLHDTVTGLVWPPVVVCAESVEAWGDLFGRAVRAGLDRLSLNGVTSDGVSGLRAWLQSHAPHVHQQRCIWHLWRTLGAHFAHHEEAVREALKAQVRAVLSASRYELAESALAQLAAHPQGSGLARQLRELLDEALMHLLPEHQGLSRIGPEHLWRDFRLRLSHGRNHGSERRLEQATLLWAVYHNFTPAQMRCERQRHYQHPGLSPLEVAGSPPGAISYLDALLL